MPMEHSAQRKVHHAQAYNSMASEYSYASLYGCTDRVGNRQSQNIGVLEYQETDDFEPTPLQKNQQTII